MAEILSQNQIDELLNELADDKLGDIKTGLEEKPVKIYDFKSPKKLSRDQNKVLSSIADVLARHLAAYFAGILRNYSEITVASIEEHPYYEYNNSLPDMLMTAVIDIDSINGSILMDMSNSLTFTLISRMLGGTVDSAKILDREFTEIEIALMERVYKKICIFIQEALANIPYTNVTLSQIETNSRFIKSIRIQEVVEVIVLNVNIGSIKGTITTCVPYTYVDTMLVAMAQNNEKIETIVVSEEVKRSMLDELSNSLVEVCGILGSVKLPLKDVVNMQVGDVIKLEQRINSPALVTVNGNTWFLGEPGIKKTRKAIRLSSYYRGKKFNK
ncbi:MAG: flagellar motor switch protein FliM [Clostridiales bacterium GWF2_38_85]|nr:MAG: flagellar motor switch protein FliM [Clostridiales bacterium GWF2_38_85]HBL83419.1 flagellar motor switch protein FliM [Clostridiales bacterium]